MSGDEDDVVPVAGKLRLVSSQDEPLPSQKRKKIPAPPEASCDGYQDDDDENCDDDDDDGWPRFVWKAEEVSKRAVRREDLSFSSPIALIKRRLRTYGWRGRNSIEITVNATMNPSDVAVAFADELNRRQTYSVEYLDALISDLNQLLKSTQKRRRQILKFHKAK